MFLKVIKYAEFKNRPEEWFVEDFILGKINLIVGKNASGKTRSLNIIGNLANLVSGDRKMDFTSGDYSVNFDDDGNNIEYKLAYENKNIIAESFISNGKTLLDRGLGGKGTIFAVELNKDMNFQSPENELACVYRRDAVQHPYFDSLYKWGKASRHYYFGTPLGKDYMLVPTKDDKPKDLNLKDTNKVTGVLKDGINRYGGEFVSSIIKGMDSIGYKIDDVGVEKVPGIIIQEAPLSEIEGVYVKESDLNSKVYQYGISQGMFRALSLIIQLNYSRLASMPSCILVDDIGEGLDYERSTSLIKYLIEEVKDTSIQLIMTTNDRFVMNSVPLEYWSAIQRIGSKVKMFNYHNSKEIFDDFKFTGLLNFDFLSSEFYSKGFEDK
jgi:energy-coupling factor transporter ATP-binding protein EcfA2